MRNNREKLAHLNLVLRTIRNVIRLLGKEKDRTRLLQGICDTLIENRGYYNAWIALLDKSSQLLETAEAGLGQEFLPMLELLRKGDLTNCAQRALTQSEIVLTESPLSACIECPLSKKYTDRSAMTVRLKRGGKTYGILCVSIPQELTSDEEEHRLLKEIAGDIAFGLHTIELEEERKQAEEALRESEQRFRDLVENSLVGISIIQDHQVVYQNPEQAKLLGSLPRPSKLTEFGSVHPDDVEKVREFYQDITSGKVRTQDMDFRFYPVDEGGNRLDMKWVNCRASTIEYQGKEAVLVNIMDVTRAKELEHLLRIQDKMSSLGRVASGIAHEIRNPLSGINIYLNTLEKIYDNPKSSEKVKAIVGQLKSASVKIESIIKRVMDFSKPGMPKLVLAGINQPIEEAINLSSVTLRKRGIKIEKFLAEDLPPCHIDRHMFEEVILNLITNAAEAMKDTDGAKKIEVSSSLENNCILVKVSDSGPGVPSNLRDKIFDPFCSTKNGSTGIGLSISHRIISDHGGSLGVATSKWGGAEFRIKIPIEKPKA